MKNISTGLSYYKLIYALFLNWLLYSIILLWKHQIFYWFTFFLSSRPDRKIAVWFAPFSVIRATESSTKYNNDHGCWFIPGHWHCFRSSSGFKSIALRPHNAVVLGVLVPLPMPFQVPNPPPPSCFGIWKGAGRGESSWCHCNVCLIQIGISWQFFFFFLKKHLQLFLKWYWMLWDDLVTATTFCWTVRKRNERDYTISQARFSLGTPKPSSLPVLFFVFCFCFPETAKKQPVSYLLIWTDPGTSARTRSIHCSSL